MVHTQLSQTIKLATMSKLKYVIGVDPGRDGCFWAMNPYTRQMIAWIDMPLYGNDIDPQRIVEFLKQFPVDETIAVLEDVHWDESLKSAKASFQYGKNVMIPEMAFVCMGFKTRKVSPTKWKGHFALICPNVERCVKKKMSVDKACAMSPEDAQYFKYPLQRGLAQQMVSKDGRAEAFLIATYAVEALILLETE